jgi:hypothetical protein
MQEYRAPQCLLETQLANLSELRAASAPRRVIARLIGRKLFTDEHVHHRNGDHEDNRPENWEVLSAKAHVQLHTRQVKAQKYREWEQAKFEDTSLEDILWSRIAKIDLSEIARG